MARCANVKSLDLVVSVALLLLGSIAFAMVIIAFYAWMN
jgi:hypothetical protein